MAKKLIVVETLFEYVGEVDDLALDARGMPKTPFDLKRCFRMAQVMDSSGVAHIMIGPYERMAIRNYMTCRPPTPRETAGYEKNLDPKAQEKAEAEADAKAKDSPLVKARHLPVHLPPPPGR